MPYPRPYDTIWGSSTPTSSDLGVAGHHQWGNRIKFTSAGVIIGMRYARDGRHFGLNVGSIWDASSTTTPLRIQPFKHHVQAANGFVRWENVYFHREFRIVVNHIYLVAVWFENVWDLYNNASVLTNDLVVGPITVPHDTGSAHCGAESTNFVFPTADLGGDLNGVDVIFRKDGV